MIFYHGTNHNIDKFLTAFVGTGNDQHGPGIYFTDSIQFAKGYGTQVYEVDIIKARLRNGWNRTKPQYGWIRRVVKSSPDHIDTAQNWDEDPETGLRKAIYSIIDNSENYGDCIQSIWAEFFMKDEERFINELATRGIDGIVYKNEKDLVLTLFNPAAIRSTRLISLQKNPSKYFAGLDEKTAKARAAAQKLKSQLYKAGSKLAFAMDLPGDNKKPKRKSQYSDTGTLKEISEKYDAPLESLKKIYNKGLAAWASSGHRPGASQHAWARARVMSVLQGGKARQVDKKEWSEILSFRSK
jgi:hypothetical protein